jgi:hypothetical protein
MSLKQPLLLADVTHVSGAATSTILSSSTDVTPRGRSSTWSSGADTVTGSAATDLMAPHGAEPTLVPTETLVGCRAVCKATVPWICDAFLGAKLVFLLHWLVLPSPWPERQRYARFWGAWYQVRQLTSRQCVLTSSRNSAHTQSHKAGTQTL